MTATAVAIAGIVACEPAAAQTPDGKDVFAIGGHGIATHLLVNSASGRLADTTMTLDDRAAIICPVGVGRKSQGPTGVLGLTTTSGRPWRAKSKATASAINLERL